MVEPQWCKFLNWFYTESPLLVHKLGSGRLSVIDSVNIDLSKLQEIVKDREVTYYSP